MKMALFGRLLTVGLAATMLLCGPVKAASELENRDAAFSLLIEAFGEVQGQFIENDYRRRLQAAGGIADAVARRHAFELAMHERDLRMGKLKRQLTEMAVVYHYSRQINESAGTSVPEKIDPAAAARSLKGFVLIGGEAVQGSAHLDR